MALWLNWIEQPPPKGQVGGSNPPRVTKLIQQLQQVTIFLKIYNPKKTPKILCSNRVQKINKFSYVKIKLFDNVNQVYFLNFRHNFTHYLSKVLITRPAFESKKDRSVKLNMNTTPLIDFIS